jgi:hypothetical protein
MIAYPGISGGRIGGSSDIAVAKSGAGNVFFFDRRRVGFEQLLDFRAEIGVVAAFLMKQCRTRLGRHRSRCDEQLLKTL